jgi:hypothetical protein
VQLVWDRVAALPGTGGEVTAVAQRRKLSKPLKVSCVATAP